MAEVIYSINGKYFKDFGIGISDSDGLFDALKRKPVNTYDWAEYNGVSADLSKPKFEAREITLKGFVIGSNWETMKSNFDAIVGEFMKPGTQRLLIEPLGGKPLPYEVYMEDGAGLNKSFKNGKMVGLFTLKMIEPNPIKKVLYLTGSRLNLSYTCPTQTEIFYGNGLKEVGLGNVSFSSKTLNNRIVTDYRFPGRNILLNSGFTENIDYWSGLGLGEIINWNAGTLYIDNANKDGGAYQVFFSVPQKYTLSFDVKPGFQSGATPYKVRVWIGGGNAEIAIHSTATWQRYSVTIDSPATTSVMSIQPLGNQKLYFDNIKMELGAVATAYTPNPIEQKFIIIAGNVDEITNLTTNATVLWEQL